MGGNWGLAASDSARQLLLGCSPPALGCWVLLAHCWLLLTWLVRLLLPNSGPHPDAFESHQSVSTPKSNVVRIMYFKHQAISRRRGVIKTRWVITQYRNIFPLLSDFSKAPTHSILNVTKMSKICFLHLSHTSNLSFFLHGQNSLENIIYTKKRQFFALNL